MENKVVTLELRYATGDIRGYTLRNRLGTILVTACYIFVAFFVLYVIGSRYLTESIDGAFRTILVGFLFGVPVVSVLINLLDVERKSRAKARRKPVMLTADETGVSYSEEHRTATFEWPAYTRGIEQKDHFVFASATGGLLIPKSCFKTTGQLEEFRELAKQGLNDKFRVA